MSVLIEMYRVLLKYNTNEYGGDWLAKHKLATDENTPVEILREIANECK